MKPKRVLMLVSNPTVSEQTGWPIGFWWAELTHPYWAFAEKGYEVDFVSPKGGELQWDEWSDPRHESGYSSHDLIASSYEAGKATALVCHATSALLKTRLSSGQLLVEGKTWTGFANSEEQFADEYVGQRIQPFWIEDEAKQLNTNFIVDERFKPHAVRDGNLITGQQQYSGAAAAHLVIEVLEE